MNKKFSTLMALALLAGSLPVAAQYCPQDGEVPYRTRMVKSAKLDKYFQDVYEINENYWYQLQVDPRTLETNEGKAFANDKDWQTKEYVLTVERDYSTGKLYLTARPSTEAVLTHSLWQIKSSGRDIDGKTMTFVNRETGFELTYDHYNALTRKGDDGFQNLNENTSLQWYKENNYNTRDYGWDFEKDGLQDGCNFGWELYTNKSSNKAFDFAPVYSYFHAGDSVMYLRSLPSVYASEVMNGTAGHRSISKAIDVDGSAKFAIIAAKESEGNAMDYIQGVAITTGALRIRPVVAGAKVLNAAEINTMIDADGSYLSFGNGTSASAWTEGANWIKAYDNWYDAKEAGKVGKFAKFTVLNPETREPLNIVDGTNPFAHAFTDGKFKAEQGYKVLDRSKYDSDEPGLDGNKNNMYAGYDVLLRTLDPTLSAGGQDQYEYLYVSEHNYEATPTGNYNGLKVELQPYAYIESGAGTANAKVKKPLKFADRTKTDTYPDALEARYHWKVTYYATNDSLVLEPLNASRMNDDEMRDKLPFEKTHLATAWSSQWLNTVNSGVAYNGTNNNLPGTNHDHLRGTSTNHQGNSMYNKAAGVPVALYAMNNSSVGDQAQLLTVGSGTGKDANGNGVQVANENWKAVYKGEVGNPAYVTNYKGYEYQAEMRLRLTFDNDYTPLQRATVESGLYYINLQSKKVGNNQQHTENREFGAYIVEDFKGHVVYDASQDEQDFSHMPATQWVVEQQPCLEEASDINYNKYPTVRIYNREFANCVFDGQLYVDKNDANKLFTINHRDYNWAPKTSTVDNHVFDGWHMGVKAHNGVDLNCADTIAFQKVANPTTLGYFNANEDILRENVYRFQQMYNMNLDQFLGIQDLNAQMDTLKLLPETADGLSCEFELFRAEGWYPEAEYKDVIVNGEVKQEKTGTFKFNYSDSLKYGYPSEDAPQLYKTYYKVKLKDANLIDNDHRFLAIKNQHKYVIAREADIQNPANNLQFAIVSLKENNCLNGEHGYAIVNAERYTLINNASSDKLEGLYLTYVKDEYSNVYEVYFFKDAVSADDFKKFEESITKRDIWTYAEAKTFGKVIRPLGMINDEDGNWDMTGYPDVLNHYNAEGKLLVEPITLEAKVSTSCETVSDVFALVQSNRPLYRTLDNELVLNNKKAIDIKTVDASGTAGDESLIEDSHSSQSKLYNMNYLGVENYGNPSKNEGFYVDFVQASKDSRMPQYMFVVAADSVPAYEYCDCGIDGHAQHGINSGCGHSEDYAGYVAGRFLVNFNDSVKASIDKLIPGIDKFSFNNYTRLGFVEAVHRGDSLYVLKAPYTLDMIMEASADQAENGKKYIVPTYLSKDSAGVVYDLITLTGKHNNVAFALRNTGDAEGENGESSFLIESNDCYNNPETGEPMSIYSKVGSFAGAWIKIHNNVPVLSKVSDKNGNHNTGDTTDSWLNLGDWVTGGTYGELINQAARFTFNTIDKDSEATANEEITAEGNVIVAGTNGAVVVKGAEGKNVIVSTILGKVVANEVVSSDNATIAAPAGVVVVSVDGESFKVVVK